MPRDRARISAKVWGDYACFSRPEFKTERVSYPVITPSAARGVLEAVFWKPEFRYEIREIAVLAMGHQTSILRNEIADRQEQEPIVVEESRQWRMSLVLRNVAYVIHADMVLWRHATDPIAKYSSQFNRRLARGQFHHVRYLGVREFDAHFAPPDEDCRPDEVDLDLGNMLFEIAYVPSEDRPEMAFMRHDRMGARRVQGYAEALFFPARLERGRLRPPDALYDQLYQTEGRGV